MDFHRSVGALFSVVCLGLLLWAFATPGNEDHWINVVMHSILTPAFAVSALVDRRTGGILQVLALLLGSGLVAYAGDLQPAGVVGTVAVLLTFAYSEFRTINQWTLFAVTLYQFVATLTGALISGYDPGTALGHAFIWSIAPLVLVWLTWKAFREFASKILKITAEVQKTNEKLTSKGVVDAAERH